MKYVKFACVAELRLRRAAPDEAEATVKSMRTESSFTVAEFAGKAILEYTILDE